MTGWRFWRRKQRDADLDEEIAFDLAAESEERMRLGLPPREAEQASHRDFGNVAKLKEDVRESWGWTWLERLGQDLRYGARSLRGNPLFTSMVVLSLALGIGANTAMFSVMDAILFRTLPVRNPGELVIPNWSGIKAPPPGVHDILGNTTAGPAGGWTSRAFPWAAYKAFAKHDNLFSAVVAYKDAGRLNLVAGEQAELGAVQLVSGNFFSGLGIGATVGRLLSESDDSPSASPAAVLSHSYWLSRFAGDPSVVGQKIVINRLPFVVAGVAAPEFFGVVPGNAPLVYIPIVNWPAPDPKGPGERFPNFSEPGIYWVEMIARLRPGVTMARARQELAGGFHQIASAAASGKESAELPALGLEDGSAGVDSLRLKYAKPLVVLMTMVTFILAIACANITNLLLSRAVSRRREMAVRLSLGASRLRLLRQLLTESVLLACLGGIFGLGVAAAGIRFLVWLMAGGRDDFHLRAELDWRVMAFTAAIAILTGILFGFAPAMAATRVNVAPVLKETRVAGRRGRLGLGQILVVAQIALSLLLVLGAALFVRTLTNLNSVEVGYKRDNLLTFSLNARQAGYEGPALAAIYLRVEEQLRALPGVLGVTETDRPLNGGAAITKIAVPGEQLNAGDPRTPFWMKGVRCLAVGPAFFETMQAPILLGRAIDRRDAEGAPLVAVINEVLAKRYFPNRNPIGRRIQLRSQEMTVIGVAMDAPDLVKDEPPAFAYIPYLQSVRTRPSVSMYFAVRTAGNPLALAGAVRNVVRETVPGVPVAEMMTQWQRIGNSITQERTFADLCTAFAILALVIACVGLYGSMAYAVSRRTNEIGIRMALGAERGGIIWMILREVLILSAAGLAIGLACAWQAKPVIQSFLFGVKPADPAAVLAAAGILFAALLVAGYAPARRASRIDPLAAVRHE